MQIYAYYVMSSRKKTLNDKFNILSEKQCARNFVFLLKYNQLDAYFMDQINCPKFPDDLRIGREIIDCNLDSFFDGFFDEEWSTLDGILPTGKAIVILHTHGLRIAVDDVTYDIHNSQIISIDKESSSELRQEYKSNLGRVLPGGMLMGTRGVILGGLSSIEARSKRVPIQYVSINFWDVDSKTPQTILISCEKDEPVDEFINRQKAENALNISQNRVAGDDKHQRVVIAVICSIIFCILFVIFIVMSSL